MTIPVWASELIAREFSAFIQQPGPGCDVMLIEAARRLRAWPVYGDLGGVLLVAADGAVHYQEHNTMEARPEPDPRWRSLAWAAAAELVPELRPLLPKQPAGVPECPACGGTGRVQVTRHTPAWCGGCWGLGWRRPDDEPLSMPPTFSKNEHH